MQANDYDNKNEAGFINPRHNQTRVQKVSLTPLHIALHCTFMRAAAGLVGENGRHRQIDLSSGLSVKV